MLIPVVVFLIMGERRDEAMNAMKSWLLHHQRMINVVVMGLIGTLLLFLGLTGMD